MSISFTSNGSSRAPPGVDLAAFASHARSIDVLGDDIAEVNMEDDMGLNLLANSPKTQTNVKQVSFGDSAAGADRPSMSIKPAADILEMVDLDSMTAATDVKIVRPDASASTFASASASTSMFTDPAPFVLNMDSSTSNVGSVSVSVSGAASSQVDERVKKEAEL